MNLGPFFIGGHIGLFAHMLGLSPKMYLRVHSSAAVAAFALATTQVLIAAPPETSISRQDSLHPVLIHFESFPSSNLQAIQRLTPSGGLHDVASDLAVPGYLSETRVRDLPSQLPGSGRPLCLFHFATHSGTMHLSLPLSVCVRRSLGCNGCN